MRLFRALRQDFFSFLILASCQIILASYLPRKWRQSCFDDFGIVPNHFNFLSSQKVEAIMLWWFRHQKKLFMAISGGKPPTIRTTRRMKFKRTKLRCILNCSPSSVFVEALFKRISWSNPYSNSMLRNWLAWWFSLGFYKKNRNALAPSQTGRWIFTNLLCNWQLVFIAIILSS